ncbi:MAG: hypothetical protein FJX77_03575 [Armatimonadetes bacterium]|nr:hypothetical protein [Armatimonadota bacterium]
MAEPKLEVQPFLDWYGIWAGQAGLDEQGEAWVQDPPVGIRLAVQPARHSPVFIAPERPWEERSVSPTCVLRDGGLLKMWYFSAGAGGGGETFVAYAESEDGFTWRRPELGIQEYGGNTRNNLLFKVGDFELQSVFVDPSAPPEARYKGLGRSSLVFHKGVQIPRLTREQKWEIRRQMDEEGYTREQKAETLYFHGLLRGAVSPDGMRWKFLEEPLLNVGRTGLDSQNIAAYDPDTQQYVGYLRGHQDRRRAVRRTEGREFGNWSPTRVVFGMDPQDPIDTDVYTSAYCRCPSSGRHLIFPSIYHRHTSTVDIQFASSRDGLWWSRAERKPIIPREPFGTMYAMPNLVPLNQEEWGLGFIGQYDLHDWGERYSPLPPPEWRWALWKRERLVALEAPVEGRVTLVERECRGGELRLNYQGQKEGGWIKVELVEPPTSPASPVKPFPGFSLAEADVLKGDELSRAATWKGSADLSSLKGRKVSVRLHLARAKLYSMAM